MLARAVGELGSDAVENLVHTMTIGADGTAIARCHPARVHTRQIRLDRADDGDVELLRQFDIAMALPAGGGELRPVRDRAWIRVGFERVDRAVAVGAGRRFASARRHRAPVHTAPIREHGMFVTCCAGRLHADGLQPIGMRDLRRVCVADRTGKRAVGGRMKRRRVGEEHPAVRSGESFLPVACETRLAVEILSRQLRRRAEREEQRSEGDGEAPAPRWRLLAP